MAQTFSPQTPDLPLIEAVVRSPLGEVRVWIDPADGVSVRTSIRLDYAGPRDADPSQADLARVAAQMDEALKSLNGGRPLATNQTGPFTAWLSERVMFVPRARTLARDLYVDYLAWCAESGAPQSMSQRAFGSALADRQITRAGKSVDGLIYRGGAVLRPRPEPPLEDDAAPAPADGPTPNRPLSGGAALKAVG